MQRVPLAPRMQPGRNAEIYVTFVRVKGQVGAFEMASSIGVDGSPNMWPGVERNGEVPGSIPDLAYLSSCHKFKTGM